MSWDLRQLLLGFHILLGIIWFGGVLFVGWGVFPASQKLQPTAQREFLSQLMAWVHWPFSLTGIGVIVTGIILGTIGGPLKSWEAVLTTSYGHLFTTAFIVAVVTLLWGMFIGYNHTMKVFSQTDIWKKAEEGNKKPLTKAFIGIAALESVEIIGFLIILTCMILI